MSAVWDRIKSGPSQNDSHSSGGGSARLGGGSARGAYYGGLSTTTSNLNFNNGANYSYSIKGGPAPPRPPREFVAPPQASDDLLFVSDARALPPRNPQRDAQRSSSFRPTSSIYSQPSPLNTNFRSPDQRRTNDAEDVSPPSSPEILTPRDGFLPNNIPSPDISPIDEIPPLFAMSHHDQTDQGGQQSRSNIPMMRRERRQDRDQAARTLRESRSKERLQTQMERDNQTILSQRGYKGGEVRWDPRTGELTSSAKGRPSQVKPAEYAKGLANSPPSVDAERRQEPPRAPSAFGERMRTIAKGGPVDRSQEPLQSLQSTSLQSTSMQSTSMQSTSSTDPALGAFSSERPAWHGASGRTTLVAPVKDTKDVAPLVNIPRKSSKRASTMKYPSAAPRGGLDTIMASPPVSPPPGAETLDRETIRQVVPSSQLPKQPPQQAQAYPSPPLSGDISAQDGGVGSPRDHAPAAQEPLSSSHQIKRKPAAHKPHDSTSSSYSQSDPFNYNHYGDYTPGSGAPPPPVPVHQEWTQPPSRFSVTTYDATPRESLDEFDPRDAPPVPSVSDMFRSSSAVAKHLPESIMDRRRPPKLGHDDTSAIAFDEPIVISLDPWTDGGGSFRDKVKPTRRPGQWDAGSVHKVLPPAPPEQSAKDRVAQLNAQLSGLAQRRTNITRSIEQMTKLMPTDSIMASAEVVYKREMEKRKVEGLKTELSEVQREEYELGLKLHRAYKRMDREAEFEPTTLWVRRVTG